MSLEKSLSQHFSSILQCVDARNDYTGLVIRVYDALAHFYDKLRYDVTMPLTW